MEGTRRRARRTVSLQSAGQAGNTRAAAPRRINMKFAVPPSAQSPGLALGLASHRRPGARPSPARHARHPPPSHGHSSGSGFARRAAGLSAAQTRRRPVGVIEGEQGEKASRATPPARSDPTRPGLARPGSPGAFKTKILPNEAATVCVHTRAGRCPRSRLARPGAASARPLAGLLTPPRHKTPLPALPRTTPSAELNMHDHPWTNQRPCLGAGFRLQACGQPGPALRPAAQHCRPRTAGWAKCRRTAG